MATEIVFHAPFHQPVPGSGHHSYACPPVLVQKPSHSGVHTRVALLQDDQIVNRLPGFIQKFIDWLQINVPAGVVGMPHRNPVVFQI
jgi:hypothetical protein